MKNDDKDQVFEQVFQGIFGDISDKTTMSDKDLKRIHSLAVHTFVGLTENILEVEREMVKRGILDKVY